MPSVFCQDIKKWLNIWCSPIPCQYPWNTPRRNAVRNLARPPMTTIVAQQTWRKAAFFCRCLTLVSIQCSSARLFCTTCSYLVPATSETNLKLCPGCQIHESWKHSRAPCLRCQFASIVSQNPFGKRYTTILNTWLPAALDSDSNSTNSNSHTLTPPTSTPISSFSCSTDPARLTKMRQLTFEDSFNEIRSRSSPEQCQYVIENITMLQQDFKQKKTTTKETSDRYIPTAIQLTKQLTKISTQGKKLQSLNKFSQMPLPSLKEVVLVATGPRYLH